MQINSQNNRLQHMTRRSAVNTAKSEAQPEDSVSLGKGFVAMGLATGAIGVGAPAAAIMGGIKIATNASTGLGIAGGVALGVAGALIGTATVPMSLMGAAMSTDSGDTSGANAYLWGAGLTTVGAGAAIFLS